MNFMPCLLFIAAFAGASTGGLCGRSGLSRTALAAYVLEVSVPRCPAIGPRWGKVTTTGTEVKPKTVTRPRKEKPAEAGRSFLGVVYRQVGRARFWTFWITRPSMARFSAH